MFVAASHLTVGKRILSVTNVYYTVVVVQKGEAAAIEHLGASDFIFGTAARENFVASLGEIPLKIPQGSFPSLRSRSYCTFLHSRHSSVSPSGQGQVNSTPYKEALFSGWQLI
ncbi:hypothetical protein NDU88_006946 [Pleurodeles waltl]|uniref:Uncharacterized protein n=1 Tax=Pleurodeles waltl TaxID=8319 RepID=A0AAV7TZS3_PLEWA|nr:hypothetical protein NDU88_006946 [Pleurodeles waltl]